MSWKYIFVIAIRNKVTINCDDRYSKDVATFVSIQIYAHSSRTIQILVHAVISALYRVVVHWLRNTYLQPIGGLRTTCTDPTAPKPWRAWNLRDSETYHCVNARGIQFRISDFEVRLGRWKMIGLDRITKSCKFSKLESKTILLMTFSRPINARLRNLEYR